MKKKVLSLLLVLAFLLGLLPGMALAGDEPVPVAVQTVPNTVTVQFFTDEACETPVDAAAVTENGVEGKYNKYTLTLPAGTYYYRGMDGSVELGGGTLVLTEAEGQTVNLIRHNFYVNNTEFNTIKDYSLTGLKDLNGAEVVLGTPYVDLNKVYTPALLIGGMEYDGGTISIADSKLDGYYPGTLSAFTPNAKATTAQPKTLPVTAYKTFSLTAPSDAAVEFYNQTKNFVVSLMDRSEMTETDNGDGTTTYAFKSKTVNYNGQYSFRVSKTGEATQAGFFQNGEAVTVTFPRHSATEPASSEGLMGSDDRSVLLNVGSTNELHLGVGDTFRLRAFRAPWEIVDSTTGNHMIEPDFHFSVLSGSDVVSIAPVTDAVTGNASGNWMTVEALKEGSAVVAVWYDAIDVYTYDSKAKAFSPLTYGAADPARYGVFVVTVGEDNTVTWNPVSADGDWDSEFDTVHYTGENGVFTFKPAETLTSVTVTNVCGTQMGEAQSVTASEDGSYAVPVTEGANIIAATTAAGTDYFVVRAKKITVTVTNNTTGKTDADDDFAVTVGDSLTVRFDKLAMPVPKMSGIYNPGYLGTMKTVYTLNDTCTLSSKGAQYSYPDDSSITFTAYIPGENVLTGGATNMTSMGDPFGNHRNLTDEGRAANLDAQEVPGIFGTLPDVSFTVSKDPEAQIDPESLTKLKSVSIYNGPSTFMCGVNIKDVSASKDYSWTSSMAAQMAAWDFHFLVTAESYYNNIEARYWYEGESVHTMKLTSGIASTVPASEFAGDASKMLNVEIVVTPADPELGDAKVYSYVVMGGTTNLNYVHPALRSLTLTDEAGTALSMEPTLNYSVTEYALDVGSAQKLTLNGQQLQKFQNAANNAQDKSDTVTLTLLKSGSPVGESVTVLPETEDRYPVGKWTLEELDISGADAIRIDVSSYVNGLKRSYVIDLEKEGEEAVTPAEDAEILLTVSVKGVLAADKEGAVMVNRTVTVSDLNEDGKLSVDEALAAAHKAYSSESGYATTSTDYGMTITKLWGAETYNTLIFVNGEALFNGVGTDTVAEGDSLLASVNADDMYYSDWYTAFDLKEKTVETDERFVLTLTGCQGMAYPFDPTAAAEGVQIGVWENSAFSAIEGAVTDETGSATLSFEKPGTYYVTAKGAVSDDVVTDWGSGATEKKECPVIAPVCVVTVTQKEKSDEEPSEDDDIIIYFTLLGDTLHGETVKHTYAAGNLVTWMARAPYTIEANTTVGAFLDWLDDGDDRISVNNPGGNYIESITFNGVTLGEFDNTNVSGWMYLLNGTHPDKGVAEQRLSDGDELVIHFTDDYTLEQGSEEWNDPGTEPEKEPDTPISPITEPVQPSGKAKVQEYAAQNGKVPVIVNANGTKTVIKKAYQDGETVYALVPDGAKVEFIDNAKRFTDVKEGDWYAEAAGFVTAHELYNGIGAGVFAPDMPMSRAMLVTVLYRLEDMPDCNVEAAFSDVLSGDWYADAVLWALENHITEGMGNGAFGADMDVTREQIATFLYRYAKYINLDVSASGSLETFPDRGKVSGWAQDAMKWATGAGLFRGDDHGMLNPGKSATRAEVAALLMRLVERIVK